MHGLPTLVSAVAAAARCPASRLCRHPRPSCSPHPSPPPPAATAAWGRPGWSASRAAAASPLSWRRCGRSAPRCFRCINLRWARVNGCWGRDRRAAPPSMLRCRCITCSVGGRGQGKRVKRSIDRPIQLHVSFLTGSRQGCRACCVAEAQQGAAAGLRQPAGVLHGPHCSAPTTRPPPVAVLHAHVVAPHAALPAGNATPRVRATNNHPGSTGRQRQQQQQQRQRQRQRRRVWHRRWRRRHSWQHHGWRNRCHG